MMWLIRLILGTPRGYRRTDGCDPPDLFHVRQLADRLEVRELMKEVPTQRENVF
jgi:hypothetical protein